MPLSKRVESMDEATMRMNYGNVRHDTINRMEELAHDMASKRISYRDPVS